MASGRVEVTGLAPLVQELRGPLFRNVNRELRSVAKLIAQDLVPEVSAAVAASGAPQAHAMAATVRAHSDRVPVVVVGKVNPKFSSRFTRPGSNSKLRRGSLAHGVVYGPLGGKRGTKAHENYYHKGRDSSGGALGRTVSTGTVFDLACEAYLTQFLAIMRHHGFASGGGDRMRWMGRR
jgi:hypothetical protein